MLCLLWKFPVSSWKKWLWTEWDLFPLNLSQKSKWVTEPWAFHMERFPLKPFLQEYLGSAVPVPGWEPWSPHKPHLPAETPRAISEYHHTQLPGDKGCKISTTTSFACTLRNSSPAPLYLPGAGRQQLDQGLDWALLPWHCGRSQRAKRNLKPSWEGRLFLVSPLPSRAFHPPCVLQQLIHKSGISSKWLCCSGCSFSRAEMEVSLLLCQHKAAKILIFS